MIFIAFLISMIMIALAISFVSKTNKEEKYYARRRRINNLRMKGLIDDDLFDEEDCWNDAIDEELDEIEG